VPQSLERAIVNIEENAVVCPARHVEARDQAIDRQVFAARRSP